MSVDKTTDDIQSLHYAREFVAHMRRRYISRTEMHALVDEAYDISVKEKDKQL